MSASTVCTPILRVEDGVVCEKQDVVVVEEPPEISIDRRNISITMRTPGSDEELTTGFLFSEGVLRDKEPGHGGVAHGREQGQRLDCALGRIRPGSSRPPFLHWLQLRCLRQNVDSGAGDGWVPG